ncbi:MAG: hypothetical protein ACK4K1_05025 [Flavobacterium sp.]
MANKKSIPIISIQIKPSTFGVVKLIYKMVRPKNIYFNVTDGNTKICFHTKFFTWERQIQYKIMEK